MGNCSSSTLDDNHPLHVPLAQVRSRIVEVCACRVETLEHCFRAGQSLCCSHCLTALEEVLAVAAQDDGIYFRLDRGDEDPFSHRSQCSI